MISIEFLIIISSNECKRGFRFQIETSLLFNSQGHAVPN
uniref:Uncharacterized protein n=1 Tax=Arundo donax TaxID=35708 RepID=A0A0A9CDZ8_ARUDO